MRSYHSYPFSKVTLSVMKNMTHATQYGTTVNVHIIQPLLLHLCYEHIDAMCMERLTLKSNPPRFVHTVNQAFSDNANPISEEEMTCPYPKESSHTTYQTEDFRKNSSYISSTHEDFMKKQMPT